MRRFHPELVARLELEADAISTALVETIRRSNERARLELDIDNWEPTPCPTS